jgi:hypothetical protein
VARRFRFGLLSFFLGAVGFTRGGNGCPSAYPERSEGVLIRPRSNPKVSIEGSVRPHRGFGAVSVKARRGLTTFARTLECPLVQ